MNRLVVMVGIIVVAIIVCYFAFGQSWLWERDFNYIRGWYMTQGGKWETALEEAQDLLDAPSEEQKKRAELLIRQIDVIIKDFGGEGRYAASSGLHLNTPDSRQWHGAMERVVMIEFANLGQDAITFSDENFVAVAMSRCGFTNTARQVGLGTQTLEPGQAVRGPIVFSFPPANLREKMSIVYIDAHRYARSELGEAGHMFQPNIQSKVEIVSVAELPGVVDRAGGVAGLKAAAGDTSAGAPQAEKGPAGDAAPEAKKEVEVDRTDYLSIALAMNQEIKGQWEDAIGLYQKALNEKDTPEVRAKLAAAENVVKAMALEKEGKWDEALEAYRAAVNDCLHDLYVRERIAHCQKMGAKAGVR